MPEGWGWWSAFEKQDDWLKETLKHVPIPDENTVPDLAGMTPMQLAAELQKIGRYLSYLSGQQGLLNGREFALEEVYKKAVSTQKAALDSKLFKTEAAKEAAVLNGDLGEALREIDRNRIEIHTCILSQKGFIEAYEHAWNTISRTITLTTSEMNLTR